MGRVQDRSLNTQLFIQFGGSGSSLGASLGTTRTNMIYPQYEQTSHDPTGLDMMMRYSALQVTVIIKYSIRHSNINIFRPAEMLQFGTGTLQSEYLSMLVGHDVKICIFGLFG